MSIKKTYPFLDEAQKIIKLRAAEALNYKIKMQNKNMGVKPMNNHPMATLLKKQHEELDRRLADAEGQLRKNAQILKAQQVRNAGDLKQVRGPGEMKENLEVALTRDNMPHNVGDINKVLWPFWFTASAPKVAPSETRQSVVSITQEAAFVVMNIVKAVFVEQTPDENDFLAVDSQQVGGAKKANGLKFIIRDAQSSRQFNNIPMDMNMIGDAQRPTMLDKPVLFLPNSQIEFTYSNSHPTNVYAPFIILFGYRVRVENAQMLLGTVFG
jgi:hypothetical protein